MCEYAFLVWNYRNLYYLFLTWFLLLISLKKRQLLCLYKKKKDGRYSRLWLDICIRGKETSCLPQKYPKEWIILCRLIVRGQINDYLCEVQCRCARDIRNVSLSVLLKRRKTTCCRPKMTMKISSEDIWKWYLWPRPHLLHLIYENGMMPFFLRPSLYSLAC